MANEVSNYWEFYGSPDTPWEAVVAYWSELGPDFSFEVSADRTHAWAYLSSKWESLDYYEGENIQELFPEITDYADSGHAGKPDKGLTSIWLHDPEERKAAFAILDERQGGIRARQEEARKAQEAERARKKAEEEERIKNDPDHPQHASYPWEMRYDIVINYDAAEGVTDGISALLAEQMPEAAIKGRSLLAYANLVISVPHAEKEKFKELFEEKFTPADGETLQTRIQRVQERPDKERREEMRAQEG